MHRCIVLSPWRRQIYENFVKKVDDILNLEFYPLKLMPIQLIHFKNIRTLFLVKFKWACWMPWNPGQKYFVTTRDVLKYQLRIIHQLYPRNTHQILPQLDQRCHLHTQHPICPHILHRICHEDLLRRWVVVDEVPNFDFPSTTIVEPEHLRFINPHFLLRMRQEEILCHRQVPTQLAQTSY